MRKWVQRAVPQKTVWAVALALRKTSACPRVNRQALRGVQSAGAAGGVSSVALGGEMVNETWSAAIAALRQVHPGAARVGNSGIVAPAGHQTARTAADRGKNPGAQTAVGEASAGGPAVHGATAGGARPAVVGAAAAAYGAERTASGLVVWPRDVIEAAPRPGGATVATAGGHRGAPAAPATDTPVGTKAKREVRATTTGASTFCWTSAVEAAAASTATLTRPR